MSCNDIHYIGKVITISIFQTYNIFRHISHIVGIRKIGKGRKKWRYGVRQGVKDRAEIAKQGKYQYEKTRLIL